MKVLVDTSVWSDALHPGDYVTAASFFNACRARGVQGSSTDFLICAASVRVGAPIFTSDGDFEGFAGLLPIRLYEIP